MMPTSNNKRIKTSNDEFSSTNATQTTRLIVPTVTNKNNTEELDLHFMTEEELKMLQKKGMLLPFPFLPRQRSTLTVLLIVITHTRQWNRSVLLLLYSCSPWGRTLSQGSRLLQSISISAQSYTQDASFIWKPYATSDGWAVWQRVGWVGRVRPWRAWWYVGHALLQHSMSQFL